MAVAAILAAVSTQAQTKRSDDFRARYELKEVVAYWKQKWDSSSANGWLTQGCCPTITALRAMRCSSMPTPASARSQQPSISLPVSCPLPM